MSSIREHRLKHHHHAQLTFTGAYKKACILFCFEYATKNVKYENTRRKKKHPECELKDNSRMLPLSIKCKILVENSELFSFRTSSCWEMDIRNTFSFHFFSNFMQFSLFSPYKASNFEPGNHRKVIQSLMLCCARCAGA